MTMGAPYATALQLRDVVRMPCRKFASFDKERFHSHNHYSQPDKDNGRNYCQKYNFHRQSGFSDAKVAI
jgi:hypothetical protein